MKTNVTTLRVILFFVLVNLFFVLPVFVSAQPDFIFKNPSRIAGSNYDAGATFRFSNVKPGTDAIVKIISKSGGASITTLDGASGYDEALQPTIHLPARSTGYVEFTISFVHSGSNTANPQTNIYVTPIDVDGQNTISGRVREFDEFNMGGGTINYDMLGGELLVTQNGDWFKGINTAGIDYPGIDTTAKQVMFTVANHNLSSFTYRVGAENTTGSSVSRQRSVYFKKFAYQNPMLPIYGLLSFTGIAGEEKTTLKWELAAECRYNTIYLEKSNDGNKYTTVHASPVIYAALNQRMSYDDYEGAAPVTYYRLRINLADGKINYSNVLTIKKANNALKGFKVFPTMIESSATMNFTADRSTSAEINIIDAAGRVMNRQTVRIEKGNNSIALNEVEKLRQGNYFVVFRSQDIQQSTQVIKR